MQEQRIKQKFIRRWSRATRFCQRFDKIGDVLKKKTPFMVIGFGQFSEQLLVTGCIGSGVRNLGKTITGRVGVRIIQLVWWMVRPQERCSRHFASSYQNGARRLTVRRSDDAFPGSLRGVFPLFHTGRPGDLLLCSIRT